MTSPNDPKGPHDPKGGQADSNPEAWHRTPNGDVDISIAYSNPPTDRLMALYADWAEHYDADLMDAYGYMAPADAVAAMAEMADQGMIARDARILDAGCGTGQAGALLAAAGFTHVDGADLSAEMRDVAARLGVYRQLFELDMTAPYELDFGPDSGREDQAGGAYDAGTYDAVICVGVFGYGPPHVDHLPLIMDAARPGAPVLVTVNGLGWQKMGWDETLMPVLQDAGITLARQTRIRHMVKEGIHAELLELRRG